jgi:hypothetical protein
MTVPPSEALLKGSKLYALLQDGLARMLSVVKSDKFEVVVKGECFETTLAEAVLISPKIYELLQIDPTIRTFTIRKLTQLCSKRLLIVCIYTSFWIYHDQMN